MNREDIVRMAREAGMVKTIDCCSVPNKFCGQDQWKGDINAFAVLVAAAEREACAKAAEDFFTRGRSPFGRSVASAIRARNNT